jgi:hypothetical protein
MGRSSMRTDAKQSWPLSRHFARLAWSASCLMTRRSRVQIPPSLLKALVSELLTRVSTVSPHRSTAASTGFSTGCQSHDGF